MKVITVQTGMYLKTHKETSRIFQVKGRVSVCEDSRMSSTENRPNVTNLLEVAAQVVQEVTPAGRNFTIWSWKDVEQTAAAAKH